LVTRAIIVASSLLEKPIVDVGSVFVGLRAIIARMANIPTYLARHLWVQGIDGASVGVGGTLIKLLEEQVYFCGKHIRLLHGIYVFLCFSWGSVLTLALICHQLFNQGRGLIDSE
jgi:hypothetical protein